MVLLCGVQAKDIRQHTIPSNVEQGRRWLDALGSPPTTPVEKINQYLVCEEQLTPEEYKEKKCNILPESWYCI